MPRYTRGRKTVLYASAEFHARRSLNFPVFRINVSINREGPRRKNHRGNTGGAAKHSATEKDGGEHAFSSGVNGEMDKTQDRSPGSSLLLPIRLNLLQWHEDDFRETSRALSFSLLRGATERFIAERGCSVKDAG